MIWRHLLRDGRIDVQRDGSSQYRNCGSGLHDDPRSCEANVVDVNCTFKHRAAVYMFWNQLRENNLPTRAIAPGPSDTYRTVPHRSPFRSDKGFYAPRPNSRTACSAAVTPCHCASSNKLRLLKSACATNSRGAGNHVRSCSTRESTPGTGLAIA